jgi:hypothetical protein
VCRNSDSVVWESMKNPKVSWYSNAERADVEVRTPKARRAFGAVGCQVKCCGGTAFPCFAAKYVAKRWLAFERETPTIGELELS